MAYIFAKCPRRVRLVRICILLSGSTFDVACNRLVSAAAFLASCKMKVNSEFVLTFFVEPDNLSILKITFCHYIPAQVNPCHAE